MEDIAANTNLTEEFCQRVLELEFRTAIPATGGPTEPMLFAEDVKLSQGRKLQIVCLKRTKKGRDYSFEPGRAGQKLVGWFAQD